DRLNSYGFNLYFVSRFFEFDGLDCAGRLLIRRLSIREIELAGFAHLEAVGRGEAEPGDGDQIGEPPAAASCRFSFQHFSALVERGSHALSDTGERIGRSAYGQRAGLNFGLKHVAAVWLHFLDDVSCSEVDLHCTVRSLEPEFRAVLIDIADLVDTDEVELIIRPCNYTGRRTGREE